MRETVCFRHCVLPARPKLHVTALTHTTAVTLNFWCRPLTTKGRCRNVNFSALLCASAFSYRCSHPFSLLCVIRPSPTTPSSSPSTPCPRKTVGGLARGVDPEELAGLIARALPSGASPTAEIMRDASTGIERGFGYVSVPAREGVRAGAERAIAAYNGSRYVCLCVFLCGSSVWVARRVWLIPVDSLLSPRFRVLKT